MARLAVDIGNTQIKYGVFNGSDLQKSGIVARAALSHRVQSLLTQFKIVQVLACASGESKSIATLFQDFGLSVMLLDQHTPLPFKNAYKSPATLGADRLALAAAAALYYPLKNTLVIDAGTCVTYDFKSAQNEYLGGAIAPGLAMRYQSVNALTQNLPLLKPQQPPQSHLGGTTAEALHIGISGGLVHEIQGAVQWYKNTYKDLEVVLTGGDAQFLAKSLKNGIFAPSNFLLKGLNHIMDFNTNR